MDAGQQELRRFDEIDVVAQWSQRLGVAVRDRAVAAAEAERWLARLAELTERGELSFRATFLRFFARAGAGPESGALLSSGG
jgi:hypothetical protein